MRTLGLRGSELPFFWALSMDAILQSLSLALAGDARASSLYTREPLGAPAPVHFSKVLGMFRGLPHQCEHWFAMTCVIRQCSVKSRATSSARPAPSPPRGRRNKQNPAGRNFLPAGFVFFAFSHTELQLKSLEKILIARRARSSYETCFVISFLINHKTGSAFRRCLPD